MRDHRSADAPPPLHPRQRPLPCSAEQVWRAALADADIHGENALLYLMDGLHSTDKQSGWYVTRNFMITEDTHPPAEIMPIMDEVNHPVALRSHRVFIWKDRTPEGLAAGIRHELEHARQFGSAPSPLLILYDVAIRVLHIRVDSLPGSVVAYQSIAVEADANAAAGMFVRRL